MTVTTKMSERSKGKQTRFGRKTDSREKKEKVLHIHCSFKKKKRNYTQKNKYNFNTNASHSFSLFFKKRTLHPFFILFLVFSMR